MQIFLNYEDISTRVSYSDNGVLDAFGRLRVSEPHALFDSASVLNASPLLYETILVTGGISTHLPNESSVQLSVTSSVGSKVSREQHGYNKYFPGKSQLVFFTFVMDTAVSGISKRVGYFNDKNGLYFEQDVDGILKTVLRTYVSGSAVDNKVKQTDWNLDVLNGSGSVDNPSGLSLDITKVQILLIDFQWLGAGRIRFGMNINGRIIYIHEINNANVINITYMSTGSLPVRFEIENVSSVAGASMKAICATVQSEGGEGIDTYRGSASSGITSKSIGGTRTQLISIRLAPTVSGNINRASVELIGVEIMTKGVDSVFFELIFQRAHLSENNLGGTPTWNAVNNSVVEYSVNGTTIANGSVILSGYISGATRRLNVPINSKNLLALNADGSASDWFHIAVTNTDPGSVAVLGAVIWKEIY